jgi:peptide-methionine (R)-S-oxide reductase
MKNTTETFPVTKTDEEWRRILTPEQYYVMRQHGTDRSARPRTAASS